MPYLKENQIPNIVNSTLLAPDPIFGNQKSRNGESNASLRMLMKKNQDTKLSSNRIYNLISKDNLKNNSQISKKVYKIPNKNKTL